LPNLLNSAFLADARGGLTWQGRSTTTDHADCENDGEMDEPHNNNNVDPRVRYRNAHCGIARRRAASFR